MPRTRNILELVQFVILIGLYLLFMAERDPSRLSLAEVCFAVYAFGWVLDQFATILEHGWHVYTQNLWSFLDVMFAIVYWVYLVLRLHGWRVGSPEFGQQALDVLAMGAPVLLPRIAFNLLSDNLLFVSLRSMMADFAMLTVLAAWCFCGFLLSLGWLGEGAHPTATIGKWMIYIWFGLDGTGIQRSAEFHWFLGPSLMITFAFLGNTLFLTILVSMLSNTFSTIVSNATAEIQYRRAVLTLEGVKSDAIFAYQPPFNILALVLLVPLKFVVSPRWFHKIHVTSVRMLNLPLLLIIAMAERRMLWPDAAGGSSSNNKGIIGDGDGSARMRRPGRHWFWDRWRITSHGDIQTVFNLPPPESFEDEIAVDDELTHHLIRRQYTRSHTSDHVPTTSTAAAARRSSLREPQPSGGSGSGGGGSGGRGSGASTDGSRTPHKSSLSRRDSIAPYSGLVQQLRGALSESDEVLDIHHRLEALEESTSRIEEMLGRLLHQSPAEEEEEMADEADEAGAVRTGTIQDLDRTADDQ